MKAPPLIDAGKYYKISNLFMRTPKDELKAWGIDRKEFQLLHRPIVSLNGTDIIFCFIGLNGSCDEKDYKNFKKDCNFTFDCKDKYRTHLWELINLYTESTLYSSSSKFYFTNYCKFVLPQHKFSTANEFMDALGKSKSIRKLFDETIIDEINILKQNCCRIFIFLGNDVWRLFSTIKKFDYSKKLFRENDMIYLKEQHYTKYIKRNSEQNIKKIIKNQDIYSDALHEKDVTSNTEDIINMRIFMIKEIIEHEFKGSNGNPIAIEEIVQTYMYNANKSKKDAREIVNAIIFKLKIDGMIYEPRRGQLQRFFHTEKNTNLPQK